MDVLKKISKFLFFIKDNQDKNKPVELKHYLNHKFDTSDEVKVNCNMLKPGELLAWNMKHTSK